MLGCEKSFGSWCEPWPTLPLDTNVCPSLRHLFRCWAYSHNIINGEQGKNLRIQSKEIEQFLFYKQGIDVDCTCDEFENGTPLHIAAENLSVEAAKALLGFGADVEAVDDLVIIVNFILFHFRFLTL